MRREPSWGCAWSRPGSRCSRWRAVGSLGDERIRTAGRHRGELEDTAELARERTGKALLAGGLGVGSYVLLLVAFTGLDASIAESLGAQHDRHRAARGRVLPEPWSKRSPGAAVMCLGAWLLSQ